MSDYSVGRVSIKSLDQNQVSSSTTLEYTNQQDADNNDFPKPQEYGFDKQQNKTTNQRKHANTATPRVSKQKICFHGEEVVGGRGEVFYKVKSFINRGTNFWHKKSIKTFKKTVSVTMPFYLLIFAPHLPMALRPGLCNTNNCIFRDGGAFKLKQNKASCLTNQCKKWIKRVKEKK